MSRRVVVVGGGISGLVAAYRLRRLLGPDVRLTILEQSDRLGGKLRTIDLDDVPTDVGAEAFVLRDPAAVDLVTELGLADDLVHPEAATATIHAGGATVALPRRTFLGVPADAAAVRDVLSEDGAARVAAEPDLPPLRLAEDEDVSVGEVLARRMGREVVDHLVEPLLGGVYAGRADRLGLRATMPALVTALAETGSLTGAAARLLPSPTAPRKPVFGALRGGMRTLVAELAHQSGAEVLLRTTVRGLTRLAPEPGGPSGGAGFGGAAGGTGSGVVAGSSGEVGPGVRAGGTGSGVASGASGETGAGMPAVGAEASAGETGLGASAGLSADAGTGVPGAGGGVAGASADGAGAAVGRAGSAEPVAGGEGGAGAGPSAGGVVDGAVGEAGSAEPAAGAEGVGASAGGTGAGGAGFRVLAGEAGSGVVAGLSADAGPGAPRPGGGMAGASTGGAGGAVGEASGAAGSVEPAAGSAGVGSGGADAAVPVGGGVAVVGERGGGWRVEVGSAAAPVFIDADAVVLAVPAPAARRLLGGVAPVAAAAYGRVEVGSMAVVSMVLPGDVVLPGASGVLLAVGERYRDGTPFTAKAFTFTSRKWGGSRVRLRASVGRVGEERALRRDEDALLADVLADLAELSGVEVKPDAWAVTKWGGGLPQYGVGHTGTVAEIERAVAGVPGLAVAGAVFRGVGIPACVKTATAAAERVAAHLAV